MSKRLYHMRQTLLWSKDLALGLVGRKCYDHHTVSMCANQVLTHGRKVINKETA